jgi:ABC-type glycerol-3-phosphate transport system permease component
MSTFRTYMLKKAYENVKKHGDRLARVNSLIDWEAFRPIITPMYHNNTRAMI